MNVLYMRKLYALFVIILVSIGASAQIAPTIVTNSTLFCTGRTITYSASSQDANLTYTWSVLPNKGLASHTDLNAPSVNLVFSGIVTYTVFLNSTNKDGIKSTTQTTLAPGRSATASFNASLNAVGFPTELILTNYSTYSLKNVWSFSDNSTDTSSNIVRQYPRSGTYSLSLYVKGAKGCDDYSTYAFDIVDFSSLELPNIFTPNDDGVNDVFKPITRGISSLNAWVYNRYGVLVCSWDKPKIGWDGHSTSGEMCSDGVYFVVIEALGFDGKEYKMKGTVTLIR
ncbi:hypothetical protein CNR22_03000 [Sphingobacteriaceae bacterium]|nr:hypothetical protein CNR22_03000 [Sphingobacteriaceae bacterium]